MDELIAAFKNEIELIPLGLEDRHKGQSAFNWGVHYLKILSRLATFIQEDKQPQNINSRIAYIHGHDAGYEAAMRKNKAEEDKQ